MGGATIQDNVVARNTTGLLIGSGEPVTLSGNTVCGNQTNLSIAPTVPPPDTEGNEICADDPAAASG